MKPFVMVNPDSLPKPRGYNHGVLAGGPAGGRILFISGQIGCDGDGVIVSSDLVVQFERALRNMLEVVRASGGDVGSIARLTIYVTDATIYRARLKALGDVYRNVMGKHYPAMALLEVKGLFDPGAKIEIEATAVL
jgi:enamine deaminase RidA (YjgF/YER057c/UK114 family)